MPVEKLSIAPGLLPPLFVGIPPPWSEAAICYCDQVSSLRKYRWQRGWEVSYRSASAVLTSEPTLGVKDGIILDHPFLSTVSLLMVTAALCFHIYSRLLVTSLEQFITVREAHRSVSCLSILALQTYHPESAIKESSQTPRHFNETCRLIVKHLHIYCN